MKQIDLLLDDTSNLKNWIKPFAYKHITQQKLGLELEMHGFDAHTLNPIGSKNSSITPEDIFKKIAEQEHNSLTTLSDTNYLIGVTLTSGGNFSLEPGGQIEYSSAPCDSLETLAANIQSGLQILERATDKRVLFLSHGTNPISDATHPLVVSKKRYKVMTRYFQSAPKDIRGIDMMRYSATVQPNIDILDSHEWLNAIHVILRLIPITNFMFANSYFFQGEKSHFFSERQDIWKHMDPLRSGIPTNLLCASSHKDVEHAYVHWAQKASVMFIENLSLEEQPLYGELTFEDWLKNGFRGIYPTIKDWEIHLSTLFPDLRLRGFLEIRNIDAQPFEHTLAPMALYFALLKNQKTQDKTLKLLDTYGFSHFTPTPENQNFSEILIPLLDLASEILSAQNEFLGTKVLQAYKTFLSDRQNYRESSALEFVKKYSTYFPSKEFIKHF